MGMMGQMPMMHGMNMSGMMHQMPMMQGMNMGSMMQGGMEMGGMMGQPGAGQPNATAGKPAADGVQSGELGAIAVKVTPPDLSTLTGDSLDFVVDLNATGASLAFDLADLATLRIGDQTLDATAWVVAFDHNHHVNGVLSFPAPAGDRGDAAVLTLADPAGGAALVLTWPAAE